jgi:arylsulfatase A-like enzyme
MIKKARQYWTSAVSWISHQEFASMFMLLAAIWCCMAVVEFALNLLIPGTALHNEELALAVRLLLLCYSMTILAGFVFTLGVPLWLLARVTTPDLGRNTAIRWLARSVLPLAVWTVLLLYASSWALFWQTGRFLGYEVFLFVAPHPLQVFHWVDADVAWTVLLSTLATALFMTEVIPRWTSIRRHLASQAHLLIPLGGIAIGACLLGTLLGALYGGAGGRHNVRSALLYATARNNTSGPLPYLLASVRHGDNPIAKKTGSNGLQIIRRPIVPMEKYVASVRERRLNRWNVVILIVESLRADQLRAYGSNRDVMPTLDRLANESRVFLNAYTHSSHTNYAYPTALSSHYPLRWPKAYAYTENPSYPRVLVYDVLKSLGYHTAIFSSSNEYWAGIINYLQTGNLDRFLHAANFKGATYIAHDDRGLDDTGFAAWAKETKHAGSVDDRFSIDEAIQWITELDAKPFFIAMNLQNSHLPYVVPRDFRRRFGPEEINFSIRFGNFPQDKAEIVKDRYADSLAYVDAQIGRLFEHLKRQNIWEKTIVIVTGDHGQAFYEHGFASHGGPIFNEVMKVPLIIRAPGLDHKIENRPAQHLDIAPTVLDLLGLPSHPSFQGLSLFDPHPDPNRSIYMVAQTPITSQYAIVRSGLKLIYDQWQRQYFLYDLNSDPGEQKDLASAQPATLKELAERLFAWYMLQTEYYADKSLHSREYPPILAD